ncbi:hypothetical protein BGW80DRAFT_1559459 [Lactifluus volemus]|nr:hypothetical protein BGW80DRAFT_1559459 [Lactifluus volemus]
MLGEVQYKYIRWVNAACWGHLGCPVHFCLRTYIIRGLGMRSFKLLSGLSLFLGSHASRSHLAARQPIPHSLDVRQVSNVCSSIFVPLVGGGSDAIIEGCFCTADIPAYVASGIIPGPIITFFGVKQIIADANGAIIKAYEKCSYPANTISSCTGGAGARCGFECTNGFTPSHPTTRRRAFARSHRSSVMANKKKRWVGSGVCAEMGPEWAACGVFGGRAHAWECINIANNLESCGGCAMPLTPFTPIGQDCSSLPGVADVACIMGECAVSRCLPGYVPAHDGTHCISKHRKISHSFGDEDEVELAPAKAYGLEHIPLQNY